MEETHGWRLGNRSYIEGDLDVKRGIEGMVKVDVEKRGIWFRVVCIDYEIKEERIVGVWF